MLAARHIRHGFAEEAVLDGLSFDLAEGEILCLLGASGCGKSTLLKILSGLLAPQGGEVESVVVRPGPRLGYMAQGMDLLPWLSAEDNLLLPAQLNRAIEAPRRDEIKAAFHDFGLEGCQKKKPFALSGGQQQRLILMRTLLAKPKLLLLDEPLGHLDAALRRILAARIKAYVKNAGAAAVIVTHAPDEAVFLADKLLVLTDKPTKVAEEIRLAGEDSRREALTRLALSFRWDASSSTGAAR